MNIVLIGFRGTGKSTVGRLLANSLERDFIDSDKYIESSTGKTIKSIFEEAGEEGAHGVGGRDGATGRTRRGCPGRRFRCRCPTSCRCRCRAWRPSWLRHVLRRHEGLDGPVPRLSLRRRRRVKGVGRGTRMISTQFRRDGFAKNNCARLA